MCFYNSMSAKAQKLAARYGKKSDIIEIYNEIYKVSAFTNPEFPIVTTDDQVQLFNWGLIPSWTKTEADAADIRKLTYNAKSETVFEKPSFRNAIMSRRCIVPSTGFFEWRHEGNKKIPYFVTVKDEDIFSMAGIYDVWTDKQTGEILHTFSILTTEANTLMEYVHNTKKRMPVILSKDDEINWLNPDLSQPDIQQLFIPFDSDMMDAAIINPKTDNTLF